MYPNQGTEQEKQSDTISWKGLATAAELDGNNAFRAVHVLGDPFDINNEPIVSLPLSGMLGLYWGCQDGDPDIAGPEACDPYQDPRGATFYRPMARCKMRRSFFPFCRVCETKIAEAIVLASM